MTFRPFLFCAALLAGCAPDDDALVLSDAADDAAAAAGAKALLVQHATELHEAVVSLCATAPIPVVGGWSEGNYPETVARMRADWLDAHQAYQGLEGAVDRLFPALAAALDGRYEQALAIGPDEDLFDGKGFVGLHAVERILWAGGPPGVVTMESTLPGAVAASFPTGPLGNLQATEFHYELCARLVTDVETLRQQIDGLALGSPDGYDAGLRLVERQVTKVEEAGMGFDESRYSNTTLADMRADVAAARAVHEVFAPWLLTKLEGGPGAEAAVVAGFARLGAAYGAIEGPGMPAVPAKGWSAVDPSAPAAASPFGKLFVAVSADSDASQPSSLAGSMSAAARLLGIAE